MLAFDLIDEPVVRGLIAITVVVVITSVVLLVRAWHADWRSPLWNEEDTTLEPFDDRATGAHDDRSGWEIARDVLGEVVDMDGD